MIIFGGVFEIDKREADVSVLEQESQHPDFWSDSEHAQEVMRNISFQKEIIDDWATLKQKYDDIVVLAELSEEEEDSETFEEVRKELEDIEKQVVSLEFRTMLSGEDDKKNAILTIHPGAGGTESQDWAQMLMRMYLRWMERNNFKSVLMDLQPGDEAGIKSATIEVSGEYAFGYLKAEAGIHRLVRLSPYDFNKRRHTSFASVFVYPEIADSIEVNIDPNDLRIDTYRASGAGGQHVNKTSSAVRITHIPTGIVVQCQSERSQFRNKEFAMKILLSRIYQKKKEEEQEKLSEIENSKHEIAWGHQIRSYVLHPYNLVKDHRTGMETSDTQAVLDGDITDFIQSYLMGYRNQDR